MIILGIDPGTATTGWGVIDCENQKVKALGYDYISTKAGLALSKRLYIIYNSLHEIILKYKPDVVAVEELFFTKNVKTAIAVAHARGVILFAAEEMGLEVAEYTPLQIKQAITGYGRADKKQMQYMTKQILGLEKVPSPDDVADALSAALCHYNSYKWNKKVLQSV